MDEAVSQANMSLFFNAGQCCIAGSRTFVHSSIYNEFVQRAGAAASKIKLGGPLDSSTDQGPLVSQEQQQKVHEFIDIGKKEGAKVVAGGTKWNGKGWFVQPTVFADVKDHMKIAKEEIFGPVQTILKYDDVDEVIQRANNSNYGLGAGLVSSNHKECNYIARRLRAGTIYINCWNVFTPMTVFGGYKDSGIGRELGPDAMNNYLETKTYIDMH